MADDRGWRNVDDDLPDWGDGGKVELRRKDGTMEVGTMTIDEWWTGSEEVPVASVVAEDGRRLDLFSFAQWRGVR